MVRIFINSGVNGADLASMPVTTANLAAGLVGSSSRAQRHHRRAGAFIAGSNTVSNMMFSQFQFEVAQTLGSPPPPCWPCRQSARLRAT